MARILFYVHPKVGDEIIVGGEIAPIDTITLVRWNEHLSSIEMNLVIKLATLGNKNSVLNLLKEHMNMQKEIHLRDAISEQMFPLTIKKIDESQRTVYKAVLSCLFDPSKYEISYKRKDESKTTEIALPSIRSSASPPPLTTGGDSTRFDYIEFE